MRYRGSTYQIPLEQSGFSHNKNIDTIPPWSMVHPSRNITLNEGGLRKRGGTIPLDTYAMFLIGDDVFTGSGLDDLTNGTTYTATVATTYKVVIDGTGTPDTFKWTDDDGATWTETVSITGAAQTLNNGFQITFAATTGHTLNDYWEIEVTIPEVTGLFDFTLSNGNQFIVRATSDGQLWKDSNDTIKTGWGTDKHVHVMQWGDDIFICNGYNRPTVWDGVAASTTDLAGGSIPTEWPPYNYPTQMIQHGRGNSLRNWALGCPLNNKNIYVTPDGDPDDFSPANVLVFYIETGDGFGIVGGCEFGDRLILFGKNKSFIFDDSDTNTDNWGYQAAQWTGGAATQRLIVKTPNDIICMMEDGDIYSVTAAETYGDYRAASIARPSFIHEWIKTYVALGDIDNFHAVYDPVLRAVLFFVIRSGETDINTALAYFIDREPQKAWVVLDNQDYESGFSARSSALVRQSTGVWKIYTGGYTGRVWKLNEEDRNDNSEAYVSGYRSPLMPFDDPRQTKRYDKVRIIASSEGTCDAELRWWVDNTLIDSESLTFAADGDPLGSFELGVGVLGGAMLLENTVKIGKIGKRIQLELNGSEADTDFFFSQILVDFLPLGGNP